MVYLKNYSSGRYMAHRQDLQGSRELKNEGTMKLSRVLLYYQLGLYSSDEAFVKTIQTLISQKIGETHAK